MDRYFLPGFKHSIAILLALTLFSFQAFASQDRPVLQKGIFLVATKNLDGGFFEKSVIYLIDHSEKESLGLIINRRTQVPLGHLFPSYTISERLVPVIIGGPVLPHSLFMISENKTHLDGMTKIHEQLYLTGGGKRIAEVIQAMGENQKFELFSGYSGWRSGQLQKEVDRSDWLITPFNEELLFDADTSTWERLYMTWSGRWI